MVRNIYIRSLLTLLIVCMPTIVSAELIVKVIPDELTINSNSNGGMPVRSSFIVALVATNNEAVNLAGYSVSIELQPADTDAIFKEFISLIGGQFPIHDLGDSVMIGSDTITSGGSMMMMDGRINLFDVIVEVQALSEGTYSVVIDFESPNTNFASPGPVPIAVDRAENAQIIIVPEPTTAGILAISAFGLAFCRAGRRAA